MRRRIICYQNLDESGETFPASDVLTWQNGNAFGTFLAKVRNGTVELPPPLKRFCEESGWTLFRVERRDENRLEIKPVLLNDLSGISDEFQSCLSPEGRLWIPAPLREMVGLGEQSVMMRAENGAIGIYLRKVFETLGFGP